MNGGEGPVQQTEQVEEPMSLTEWIHLATEQARHDHEELLQALRVEDTGPNWMAISTITGSVLAALTAVAVAWISHRKKVRKNGPGT